MTPCNVKCLLAFQIPISINGKLIMSLTTPNIMAGFCPLVLQTSLNSLHLTCLCLSTGGHPGAFDGGRAFSVASGACTELPVTSKSK